jgi:hypothetical protein
VKNRFQHLPFKFNLQRYTTAQQGGALTQEQARHLELLARLYAVGLCRLNKVDP